MRIVKSIWAGLCAVATAVVLFGIVIGVFVAARVGPFGADAQGHLAGLSGSELLVILVGVLLVFTVAFQRELRRLSRSGDWPPQ